METENRYSRRNSCPNSRRKTAKLPEMAAFSHYMAGRALAAILAAVLIAGCSDEPDRPPAPGEAEYRRHCATCHQPDGAGRSPTFPPLKGSQWLESGPDGVALVALLGLSGEIRVADRTWRGYMPPMRQVSDDELAALIGYIGREWADWPELPDAGRIAELRRISEDLEQLGGRADLEQALETIRTEGTEP